MRRKLILNLFCCAMMAALVFTGCKGGDGSQKPNYQKLATRGNEPKTSPTPKVQKPLNKLTPDELEQFKPNESGKIMIVMFHNIVKEYMPNRYDNGEFTTTLGAFEKLLPKLYQKGYRLIGLDDYLDNNINIPAGCIPIVFTFDDATNGQFRLKKSNGTLKADPDTAVGIMEKFVKEHPDFNMRGTFFVNMGSDPFAGDGTMQERLNYLIESGFEIGNHTFSHIDFSTASSSEIIMKELGKNVSEIQSLIPGYNVKTLALPLGNIPPKSLRKYLVNGQYQGKKYNNQAILKVGWDPALSPFSTDFDATDLHRVRSSGINPVMYDLDWWLNNLARNEQYISDGNPETVTIPKRLEKNINKRTLGNKTLIIY